MKLFQQKEWEFIRQAMHQEFHGLLVAEKTDTAFSVPHQVKGIATNNKLNHC